MTGPRPLRGYSYDTALGRYRGPTGRFVKADEVRRSLDSALRIASERARVLATRLRAGDITLERWQIEMRVLVKDTQLYATAAARGGWRQLSAGHYGQVGARVAEQYRFLDQFARELAAGRVVTDGRFITRAMSYAQAARGTFHEAWAEEQRAHGMTEERNILHPADHCRECVAMRDRGWAPIGSLLPIGQRLCRANCRCTLRYR